MESICRSLCAAALCSAWVWSQSASAQPRYALVDLHPPGFDQSKAWSVSPDGVVAGEALDELTGVRVAFIWAEGRWTTFAPPPNAVALLGHVAGVGGQALFTAKLKDVVGRTNLTRAYLLRKGQLVALPPLPGDNASQAVAMTRDGRVVGVSANFTTAGPSAPTQATTRAVMWVDGEPVDLAMQSSGENAVAQDIASDGAVLGYTQAPSSGLTPWILDRTRVAPLASPPSYSGYIPTAMNDFRVVAGAAVSQTDFTLRALADFGDGPKDLGTLGGPNAAAYDVNNVGQIVGVTQLADGSVRGFLYENNAMADLTSLISPDAGWIIESANSVNDDGWIAVTGRRLDDPTRTRAALLKPLDTGRERTRCAGDYLVDGVVGPGDLMHVLSNWGAGMTASDLFNVLSNWGSVCETTTQDAGILSRF